MAENFINIDDSSNDTNSSKNPKSKFTISFDRKWARWAVITLTLLVILLLLQLTGTNKIILKISLTFIPLGLALGFVALLNPFVNRLIGWKLNRVAARYVTFFISLIIGIAVISLLLWLFIGQFSRFILRFIGDASLIQDQLKKWESSTDSSKTLVTNIFSFTYDSSREQWVLKTNFEWDVLRKNWESYLKLLSLKFENDLNTKEAWAILEINLRNNFGVIRQDGNYVINYINFLKGGTPTLEGVQDYFTKFFITINSWVNSHDYHWPTNINLNNININAIDNISMQGAIFNRGRLGAIYEILFSFAATTQTLFTASFLIDILKTISNYTSAANIATLFITQYFWVATSILYGIFITIMLAMFLLKDDGSYMKNIRMRLIPGKNPEKKEKIAHALQKSLFGYGKGILIDMAYMFSATTLFMIIAGYAGGGSTYKSSFIVLGLFMAICNVVPYVGPFVGGVPIAIVGILDGVTSLNGPGDFVSWIPLLIAVIGAFAVQIIENTIIYPNIFSRVTSLHPVTILIGISLFAAVFGVFGMIIAVPAIATYKAIANEVYNKQLVL